MSTTKCNAHMGRNNRCGRLKGHEGSHSKVSLARREKPSASPDLDTKLIDGFLKLCATVDKLESKLLASTSAPADDDDCATEGTLPDAADMFAALSLIVNDPVPDAPETEGSRTLWNECQHLKDIALQGMAGGNLNKLRDAWLNFGSSDARDRLREAQVLYSTVSALFESKLDVRDALSEVFALKDQDVQNARCEAIKARGEAQLANLKLGVYEAALERIETEKQWRCSVCDGVVLSVGEPTEEDDHDGVNDSGEAHEADWQQTDDALLVEIHREIVREAFGRFKATVVK